MIVKLGILLLIHLLVFVSVKGKSEIDPDNYEYNPYNAFEGGRWPRTCAWTVHVDPKVYSFAALDPRSNYKASMLDFRQDGTVYRISSQFQRVRYFSYQTYNGVGESISGISDYEIQPHDGARNPFTTPDLDPFDGGTYSIYITKTGDLGFPNELKGVTESQGTNWPDLRRRLDGVATIILRLYHKDPSILDDNWQERRHRELLRGNFMTGETENHNEWGFVHIPLFEKSRDFGQTWEVIPNCRDNRRANSVNEFAEDFGRINYRLSQDNYFRQAGEPCQLQIDRAENDLVNFMGIYTATDNAEANGYIPWTNGNVKYLYWCEEDYRIGDNYIIKLKGYMPTTPTGLFEGAQVANLEEYQLRYFSIVTIDGRPPSPAYESISDTEITKFYENIYGDDWDRQYSVVVSQNLDLANSCNGLYDPNKDMFIGMEREGVLSPPRTPSIIMRELLASADLLQKRDAKTLSTVLDRCHGKGCQNPEYLQSVLEKYYPVLEVYRCNKETREYQILTKPAVKHFYGDSHFESS